jgi:steroid 5-alpha reductase family enzyme
MVTDLLVVLGFSLGIAAIAMTITAAVAWRLNRVNVVDITWGLALAAVAGVDALLDGTPSWLLFAVVSLWAVRLSGHMARRSAGQGEDPRYASMLGGDLHQVGMGRAVRKVFLIQGLAVCLVAIPLHPPAVVGTRWVTVLAVGLVIAVFGMVFEAVGDAQLAAYKRDPHRGQVMDRGLWAWTRHPNYFGDALFWWGIWIAGGLASGWWAAALTAPAPIAMTWFLAFATGARLLEKTMMQRPGYAEYAARTSMLVPLPPRRNR